MPKVISFYRYVDVENPEELRDSFREFCEKNKLLGRILIGNEGINGAISGEDADIANFKLFIDKHFQGLTFREQDYTKNTYHKLVVRIRKEICVFGKDVNLKNTGKHVSPQELKEMYDRKEDFVILDARNDYEWKVGKFKNALTLPIKNFRDFAEYAKELQHLKDKKIVMYCTGGVRCEKASAYLNEQGFNASQVDGGIINYVNQFPNTNWEGGLFVFDDRLVSDVGETITKCSSCGVDCNTYFNCYNLDCDRLFINCEKCRRKMNDTCSEECRNSKRQRKEVINKKIIGIVENYYAKNNIALIKVIENIKKGNEISFTGKTTNFSQKIPEMRNEDGKEIDSGISGNLITLPVLEKVRKNDKVVVVC